MKAEIIAKLLQAHQKHGKPFRITVEGISMNPVLVQGDVVTLREQEEYRPGEILVFEYQQEGVLVHRLVKRKGDRYWCKGDNAFRTEEIGKTDIIGRVIAMVVGDREIPTGKGVISTWMTVRCSLAINRRFRKAGSVAKTKTSLRYRLYKRFYLDRAGKRRV